MNGVESFSFEDQELLFSMSSYHQGLMEKNDGLFYDLDICNTNTSGLVDISSLLVLP